MIEEDFLNRKLQWIAFRLEKLNQIEAKLLKMKHLAEFARDYKLSSKQLEEINAKLGKLRKEVIELDQGSKSFWLENQ